MHLLSSRWLKLILSLGLLTLLLRSLDLNAFREQLAAAQLNLVVVAFLGYLLSQVMSAYKWQVLAQAVGFDHPFRAFVVYYFVGMYVNLFVPSSIAGDVGRGLFLAASSGRVSAALQSVLADRVSGAVMLAWVSALGFLLFGPTVLPRAVAYGVIAAAILGTGGWWLALRVVPSLFSPGHSLFRVWEKLIRPYREHPALLAYVCALSFGFHCFQLSLQLILASALNLPVPWWYLMLVIPLVHLLSALPISFGGFGVREAGYIMFLALIGIGQHEALAFGFLWSALVLGAGIVGGIVLLLSSDVRLSLARIRKTSGG